MSQDLRSTFGPSGKSAADRLGGLLPTRTAPEEPPEPVVEEPQADDEAPQPVAPEPQAEPEEPTKLQEPREAPAARRRTEPAPTPAPARKASRENESRSAKSAKQFLTFVLPEVKTRAAHRQEETGESNAEIVFAAIDHTHERLSQLIALRHEKPSKPGSLFPGRKLDRTDGRDGVTREIWTYRATPAERAVIDKLEKECGAGSRSELVSVALEAFFDVTS